jgi:mono/diheme cytochrome c family protein
VDFLGNLLSAVPWPFPVRPSFENLADPEMRRLVATALSQLGLGVLLLSFSLVVRRGRLVAVLAALPLLFMQGPSLALLLVEATPSSYRESPTGFSAQSIAVGRLVFANNCTGCHGNAGDGGKAGDGEGGLGVVTDLRQSHIWSHPVGDLFWFVSHGIEAEDGAPAMPAFEAVLSERTRWSLIDYVYALNAGAVTRGLDGWPHRVPAPAISLSCATIAARGTAELRGKVISVILGLLPEPLDWVPPVNGINVVTVWIPEGEAEAAPVPGVDCVAQGGADEVTAYAVLAGAADGHVTRARFLIDPEGVLRSVWREDDGDEWADPARLLEEVQTICTEPLTIETGDAHEYHHH